MSETKLEFFTRGWTMKRHPERDACCLPHRLDGSERISFYGDEKGLAISVSGWNEVLGEPNKFSRLHIHQPTGGDVALFGRIRLGTLLNAHFHSISVYRVPPPEGDNSHWIECTVWSLHDHYGIDEGGTVRIMNHNGVWHGNDD